MLRAGPFSDERIVKLINRRFIAVAFDLFSGALHDADGKRYLAKRRPEFGGMSATNEPLMVLTPDKGRIVAETIRYHDSEGVLSLLRRALRDHEEYNRPSAAEKELLSPIARARLRMDLLDDDAADAILRRVDGDEARYLRARIARRRRDWKSAEQLLAKTKRPDLHDDVRMERAYRLWFARDYAALGKHLAGFPATSNRFAEARYYEGLAAYLGGKRNAALAIWKATVSAAKAHGPWVYRADWAYTNILDGRDRRRGFSMRVVTSGGKTSSLLGRLDYMGMSNPELSGPRAR